MTATDAIDRDWYERSMKRILSFLTVYFFFAWLVGGDVLRLSIFAALFILPLWKVMMYTVENEKKNFFLLMLIPFAIYAILLYYVLFEFIAS